MDERKLAELKARRDRLNAELAALPSSDARRIGLKGTSEQVDRFLRHTRGLVKQEKRRT